MNKIKNTFISIVMLIMTFVILFVTCLLYNANNKSAVKSFIFQMNNQSDERLGFLHGFNTTSAYNNLSVNELIDQLIRKYIAEYYSYSPISYSSTSSVENAVLKKMSTSEVYSKWKEYEEQLLQQMENNKQFIQVYVEKPNAIANSLVVESYTKWHRMNYIVSYEVLIWKQSNNMSIEPIINHRKVNIQVRFDPQRLFGIDITNKKELKKNEDPSMLFNIQITHIEEE